ncbi:MAG: DNA photolyase family protein [Hyphomonas sp.]|nr:DNA photolyase family protein [Hyphomonas sp.]
MSPSPAIMWFRRELRLSDNPALAAAISTAGSRVICVYIRETNDSLREMGGASKWWLDKSLRSLTSQIEKLGGRLILRTGDAETQLADILTETGAAAVFWNRRYDLAGREIDAGIKSSLKAKTITTESFNGSLLTEPWTQTTGSGGYYKVYSPYWRAVQASYQCPLPAAQPSALDDPGIGSDSLDDWDLHPSRPDWSTGFDRIWRPGERNAHNLLQSFLSGPVDAYGEDRNRPDVEDGTSSLSPHLAFGEISPAQIWRATMSRIEAGEIDEKNGRKFLSEVVWRDFSYVLLFHNPDLGTENYKPDFDLMPWQDDGAQLKAWQTGQTGYPIVDAGMRQLWHTGWMHNRVRMIVASFLTKHLLIHWRRGEEWFWDTLVDADPASNSASWQWTAGSGADAAPYFRIFNPITQGEKFDETGDYVRKWCPELSRLPRKYLYQPWEAGPLILSEAGITLGETYPNPIVDHKFGRERALTAYQTLKERRDAA